MSTSVASPGASQATAAPDAVRPEVGHALLRVVAGFARVLNTIAPAIVACTAFRGGGAPSPPLRRRETCGLLQGGRSSTTAAVLRVLTDLKAVRFSRTRSRRRARRVHLPAKIHLPASRRDGPPANALTAAISSRSRCPSGERSGIPPSVLRGSFRSGRRREAAEIEQNWKAVLRPQATLRPLPPARDAWSCAYELRIPFAN